MQPEEKCYTGEMIYGERFFPAWLYEEDEELVVNAVKGVKEAGMKSIALRLWHEGNKCSCYGNIE